MITENLLQEFFSSGSTGCQNKRQIAIAYVARLWAEEQWLKLPYTPRKYKKKA